MKDPYKVLGLKPDASEAEIKAAYRSLVKKYHPDKYQNNPLADLAEEKLRDVNEAYDALTKKPGQYNYDTSSSQSGSAYSYSGTESRREYMEIRAALDRGELAKAEQLLINCNIRDAEWYFLSGILSYRKGYIDDGLTNVRQAMAMDPNNAEFMQVYQRMVNLGNTYKSYGDSRGYSRTNDCSDCLSCLCITSICSPCC